MKPDLKLIGPDITIPTTKRQLFLDRLRERVLGRKAGRYRPAHPNVTALDEKTARRRLQLFIVACALQGRIE